MLRLYLGVYMPKRVLVSSLKVKTLIKLFDSSPSKMAKGKKNVTSTKSAAALAHMAEELGREEAAASTELAAAASNKSSTDTLAVFDSSILVAKKSNSDLMARDGPQRRLSDGEAGAAADTGLAAGGFQTSKGSALAPSGMATIPKGGMAGMAKSSIMRSFLNIGEKSTAKRNRDEWAASPQLANKAKRATEVAQTPPQ
jgi:hypothetical protein